MRLLLVCQSVVLGQRPPKGWRGASVVESVFIKDTGTVGRSRMCYVVQLDAGMMFARRAGARRCKSTPRSALH